MIERFLTKPEIEALCFKNLQPFDIEQGGVLGKIQIADFLLFLENRKIEGDTDKELLHYFNNCRKSDIYIPELDAYQLSKCIKDGDFVEYFLDQKINPYKLINEILEYETEW
ncbi:MAG: hypothetical protein ACKVTZ_15465 [Bacteroidia bacterium]